MIRLAYAVVYRLLRLLLGRNGKRITGVPQASSIIAKPLIARAAEKTRFCPH